MATPPDPPTLANNPCGTFMNSNGDLFSDAEMIGPSAPLDESSSVAPSFVEEFELEFKSNPRSAQTSFTADTPYYTSYVESEMRHLTTLTDTLKDISARAQTFGKCGVLMSEATRRLSMSCKLRPNDSAAPKEESSDEEEKRQEEEERMVAERRASVGEEMGSVLHVLGEVRIVNCLV